MLICAVFALCIASILHQIVWYISRTADSGPRSSTTQENDEYNYIDPAEVTDHQGVAPSPVNTYEPLRPGGEYERLRIENTGNTVTYDNTQQDTGDNASQAYVEIIQ